MKSAQLLMCSLVVLPVASAHAVGSKDNLFDLRLSADYRTTDNAERATDDELQLREQQGIYRADFAGHYENDWSRLNANYQLQKETFQYASQPDATELMGRAQLTLGNDYNPLSLFVSHVRTVMLNAPDDIDLTQNRDTQEIFTVAPSAKTHIGAADSLALMGTYTDVSYKEDEEKKSNQQGAQLAWIHSISKTDKFQIAIQQTDVSFKFVPTADYQLQVASARYDVALKHLSYLVEVGYNKAIPQSAQDEFASPTYKVESSYLSGLNTFSLSLSQSITNSSMATGDQFSPGEISSHANVPAKGVGLDLINLRNASLSWSTKALCERCEFGVRANQMQQDYQNLPEDGKDYEASTHFKYHFSRAASINFSVIHRKQQFSNTADHEDFASDEAKINVGYEITKELQLNVYVEQDRRSSITIAQNYQENIAGLKLTYRL